MAMDDKKLSQLINSKFVVEIPKKDMKKVYDMVEQNLGLSPKQWDAYRHGLAIKESQGGKFTAQPTMNYYLTQGGAGGLYDGRYQLGKDAKADAAKYLGEKNPGHDDKARAAFIDDPVMQEMYLAAYTIKNHQYMSLNIKDKNYQDDPRYNPKDYLLSNTHKRVGLLGFAHNQGHGAAKKYIVTGNDTTDQFNTKGSAYAGFIDDAATNLNVDWN